MDRSTVESQIEAAGPGGRIAIRFTDRVIPKLHPETAEAVYEEYEDGTKAATPVYVADDVGITRTMSAFVVQLIDNYVAIGAGPGQPIERLIAFADIGTIRPDPADHDAVIVRAGTVTPPVSANAASEPATAVPATSSPTPASAVSAP